MGVRSVVGVAVVVWVFVVGSAAAARGYGETRPAVAAPSGGQAAAVSAPGNDECLSCHDDDSMKRADGRSVAVHKAAFAASVHAPMNCVDCHQALAHATEFPHAEKLTKVDCASCHDAEVAQYKQSAHARAREKGTTVAATCVECHGTHDIRGGRDPESRTYHLKIAATCAACHGNQQVIQQGHIAIGDVARPFADSIHGRALNRSGLIVAPTCSDCHGAHDIRQKVDPASKVTLANVPATCGKCHEGIAHEFEGGVHGTVLAKGNNGAPACQTCHSAHAIRQADDSAWQLSVIGQCGSCHRDRVKTYRDTFHGQVTNLGYKTVATCADCHGNHRILPASDPTSPIAPQNLEKTCGKCHANATASFVKYDPHADKDNRYQHATLFYSARFMQALLIGTFAFFGIHTMLWFARSLAAGKSRAAKRGSHARTD